MLGAKHSWFTSSSYSHSRLSTMQTRMQYGRITQYYLWPDRGDDVPIITPAEAGTRFIDPGGMKRWVATSMLTRIFFSRIFRYDQYAVAGLGRGRFVPPDYKPGALPIVPPRQPGSYLYQFQHRKCSCAPYTPTNVPDTRSRSTGGRSASVPLKCYEERWVGPWNQVFSIFHLFEFNLKL